MNSIIDGYLKMIDAVNDRVGKWVSFLGLFMMVIVVIEVVSRYIFNSPTIWATEMNEMLLCAYAALAGGYALLHEAHVSVEIFQERMRRRTQAVLNLLTHLIGFVFFGDTHLDELGECHGGLGVQRAFRESVRPSPLSG